jgi:hypothetical protein
MPKLERVLILILITLYLFGDTISAQIDSTYELQEISASVKNIVKVHVITITLYIKTVRTV